MVWDLVWDFSHTGTFEDVHGPSLAVTDAVQRYLGSYSVLVLRRQALLCSRSNCRHPIRSARTGDPAAPSSSYPTGIQRETHSSPRLGAGQQAGDPRIQTLIRQESIIAALHASSNQATNVRQASNPTNTSAIGIRHPTSAAARDFRNPWSLRPLKSLERQRISAAPHTAMSTQIIPLAQNGRMTPRPSTPSTKSGLPTTTKTFPATSAPRTNRNRGFHLNRYYAAA